MSFTDCFWEVSQWLVLLTRRKKGKIILAVWLLYVIWPQMPVIWAMSYLWIWSLTTAKGFCFAYSCFVYMNYLCIYLLFFFFLTGNIWFYCCPYISFYFIGSPIMYRSNQSFNMPHPRAYPGHLTPLPSRGWEGIWLSESSRGWEFDPHALGVGNLNCTLNFM